MSRTPSTTIQGSPFPKDLIWQVWNKGHEIPNYDSNEWRRDACGKVMKYRDYGNRDSKYGWEVDHIMPVSKGGTDAIVNLQPLAWWVNADKDNQYPWNCSMLKRSGA